MTRFAGLTVWPAWSPDGRQIAFTSTSLSDIHNYKIWVVPAEGGDARLLPGDAEHRDPEWSPDGRWLTFISSRAGDGRIWRMTAEGGRAESIGGRASFNHCWSPDGSFLYYAGADERSGNIWEIRVDGTADRQATDLRGRRGYLEPLSFTTDGTYLYFTWGEDLSDIWVMDVVRE